MKKYLDEEGLRVLAENMGGGGVGLDEDLVLSGPGRVDVKADGGFDLNCANYYRLKMDKTEAKLADSVGNGIRIGDDGIPRIQSAAGLTVNGANVLLEGDGVKPAPKLLWSGSWNSDYLELGTKAGEEMNSYKVCMVVFDYTSIDDLHYLAMPVFNEKFHDDNIGYWSGTSTVVAKYTVNETLFERLAVRWYLDVSGFLTLSPYGFRRLEYPIARYTVDSSGNKANLVSATARNQPVVKEIWGLM